MGHWRNQRGNQKLLETNENGNNNPKSMRHSKNSSKRKVYSDTGLPQETSKSQTTYLSILIN